MEYTDKKMTNVHVSQLKGYEIDHRWSPNCDVDGRMRVRLHNVSPLPMSIVVNAELNGLRKFDADQPYILREWVTYFAEVEKVNLS